MQQRLLNFCAQTVHLCLFVSFIFVRKSRLHPWKKENCFALQIIKIRVIFIFSGSNHLENLNFFCCLEMLKIHIWKETWYLPRNNLVTQHKLHWKSFYNNLHNWAKNEWFIGQNFAFKCSIRRKRIVVLFTIPRMRIVFVLSANPKDSAFRKTNCDKKKTHI